MTVSDVKWLLVLLGVDGSSIPENAEVQFTLLNRPHSWAVFVLLGVVAALALTVFALYRKEIDTCPRWGKHLLTGLRVAVLLVLVFVFLGPAITYTQRHTLWPLIVLMRDDSLSMATRDRYLDEQSAGRAAGALGTTIDEVQQQRPDRTAIVIHLLETDNRQLLRALEGCGKLHVANFSHRVEHLETRPARTKDDRPGSGPGRSDEPDGSPNRSSRQELSDVRPLPPLTATGRATDLYRAVSDGLADRLTAAVILFTDGQHTAKENGADRLVALAERAARQGVPLLIVGVGDPTRPRNLQITDLYADPQVWQDAPFEIRAVLRAQGIGEQTVRVELFERKILASGEAAAEQRVGQPQEIQVPEGGGQVRLAFTHTPESPGRYTYSVRVEPVEDEITLDDNQPPTPIEVKVLSRQARVLLVAGGPTWDYQAVRKLLEREKSVDVSCWLQTMDLTRSQEGNTVINRLPITRDELFKYDVVMLFDPDPEEFDDRWIALLGEFVSGHAGGMLYMAGPAFAGRFLSEQRTSRMQKLLPVRLGDVGAMEVANLLASNARRWPLAVVTANLDRPIMRFYDDPGETRLRWETFPGICWSFPLEEAKPTARVLIEHSDPALRRTEGTRPLLVTGQYGSGRTAFLGIMGTWRWRRPGVNAEFFDRFWMQAVRYLVEGRSLEGKRRGLIEADHFRYELGDSIHVTARLTDAGYRPLDADQVSAALRIGADPPSEIVLTPVPNQPGQFEATLTARKTGRYVLSVELPDGATDGSGEGPAEAPTIETTLAVSLPSVESNKVWLDKVLLRELAEASGGRYFEVDEVDALAAAVPHRQQNINVQSKPTLLWDTNRVLLVLVVLLSLEWALRKGFKLM